jgi:hypothetical protein
MTFIVSTKDTSVALDYDWLKDAVKGWMLRDDLTDRIPDFITMAEARLNRLPIVRTMQIEAPLEMDTGSRFVLLPEGFRNAQTVWLESVQPREKLTQDVPENMTVTSDPGRPRFWCIDGENIGFDRPADQDYPVTLRYNGGFRLSTANPLNQLLTSYPDLYLSAAVVQAAIYTRNPTLLATWQPQLEQAISEVSANERRARVAAPLRTELAGVLGHCGYDINKG